MSLTNSRRRAVAATALLGSLALAVPALTTTATAAPAAKAGPVDRISGADRYEVSAAISRLNFDPNVDVAYVASGEVFTDALTGAPVAGKGGSPVLLTRSDVLPQVIADELTRLAPKKIVVFGGTNSVTGAVTNALKKIQPNLERVAAPTRYSTSAKISSLNYAVGPDTTFVASGEVYTDALSGAPVSGMTAGPVVLTDTTTLPAASAAELARLKPTKIVVLGGPNTISYAVQAQLADYLAN